LQQNDTTVQSPEFALSASLLRLAALSQLPQSVLILKGATKIKDCAVVHGGLYWGLMSSINIRCICPTCDEVYVAAFGVNYSFISCSVACLV